MTITRRDLLVGSSAVMASSVMPRAFAAPLPRDAEVVVIGAGAVVSKDVAPYTIVGGVPVELIRERFNAQTAEGMEKLAWWDWAHDRLFAALADFRGLPAEDFVVKYA